EGAAAAAAASAALGGWPSHPNAISAVQDVFGSGDGGGDGDGGSTEPLIGLVFIRWIVGLFAFSDGQGADRDAAIFARRPPKTSAAPIALRRRRRRHHYAECGRRTRTRRVRSSSLASTRAALSVSCPKW